MTECQGCGAWNDTRRTLCVLCGTPLAETDEWETTADPPPLPPLPDGGLGASMPAWLRASPLELAEDLAVSPSPSEEPALPHAGPLSLGPLADPRTFLSDDDFPRWLRDLAARQAAPAAPTLPTPAAATLPELPVPAAPDDRPPAALVAARALEERRARSPWETLLLVILFIGVILAALWALAANGVFSPSL